MLQLQSIVAANIRKHRKEKSWTQLQLAEKAGLGHHHLSRIELGKENLSLQTLARLAKALKIEPYLLLMKEK